MLWTCAVTVSSECVGGVDIMDKAAIVCSADFTFHYCSSLNTLIKNNCSDIITQSFPLTDSGGPLLYGDIEVS